MGYDITLRHKDGAVAEVARHEEGGQYLIGGTDQADLYVTYNYAELFGFRDLDGQIARSTVAEMQEAVDLLGTEQDDDYWEPTPGNAGYAVSILLRWAQRHPDAIWHVD